MHANKCLQQTVTRAVMCRPTITIASSRPVDALFYKQLMWPPVMISPTAMLIPPEEETWTHVKYFSLAIHLRR